MAVSIEQYPKMPVHSLRSTVPTVLRVGGYRLYFYAADRGEPPHVHVDLGSSSAKVWLERVHLANGGGFKAHELTRIVAVVAEHQQRLLEAWNEFFRR